MVMISESFLSLISYPIISLFMSEYISEFSFLMLRAEES